MKRILGFGTRERTPLGFCDGNRRTSLESGNENIDSHYWRNFYAKYKPKAKLHKAASAGKVEKVKSILDSGKIHVDNRDRKNRTALHFACACGHMNVVTFLIASDCKMDLRDSDSSTALIKAVQCQEEECATILLKHGADSNIKDVSGFTALHYAVCNGNSPMVTKLLAYNANIEAKTKDYLTPFLLALRESKVHVADLLIRKGANIHALDEFRRNALIYAVRCESKDMIVLLLQRGIEISHQDGFGWTALQYAAASRSRIWSTLLNYEDHEFNTLQETITASDSSEDNSLTRYSDEPCFEVFSSISKQGDGNYHNKIISESLSEKSIDDFLGHGKQIGDDQREVWAEKRFPWKPTTARTNSVPTKALAKKNGQTLQAEPVLKETLKKEQNQYDARKDNHLLEVSESLLEKTVGPFPGTADQTVWPEKCFHLKPATAKTNSVPTNALAKKNGQTKSVESVISDEERKNCQDKRDNHSLEISESHPWRYAFQLRGTLGKSGKTEVNGHIGGTYIARTSEEKQKCDGSKNNRRLNINLITLDQWKAMQESKKNENICYSDVRNSGVKNKGVTETSCQSPVQIRNLLRSTCSTRDLKEVATEMNNETKETTSKKKINNDNLSAGSEHQNNKSGLKEEVNEELPWDSESISASFGPNPMACVAAAADSRVDNVVRESPKMHYFMKFTHSAIEEKNGIATKALVEKDTQTLQSGLNEDKDENSPWDSEV